MYIRCARGDGSRTNIWFAFLITPAARLIRQFDARGRRQDSRSRAARARTGAAVAHAHSIATPTNLKSISRPLYTHLRSRVSLSPAWRRASEAGQAGLHVMKEFELKGELGVDDHDHDAADLETHSNLSLEDVATLCGFSAMTGPKRTNPFFPHVDHVQIPDALLKEVVDDLQDCAIAYGSPIAANEAEQRNFIACILKRLVVSNHQDRICIKEETDFAFQLVATDSNVYIRRHRVYIHVHGALKSDLYNSLPRLLGQLYFSCKSGEVMYGAVSCAYMWIFVKLEKAHDGSASVCISKTLFFDLAPLEPLSDSALTNVQSVLQHISAIIQTIDS